MGFIYRITTPTGKRYIGQTLNVRKRIASYKHTSKNYAGTILILKSIKKYGWDAHVFEIIEEVGNEKLNEREIFWIDEFKTYIYKYPKEGGLNLKTGGNGEGSTWMHDTERRKSQSEKMSGSGNGFYGKKHSDETKKITGAKAKERNLKSGRLIPEWGAEKGREVVRKPVLAYDMNGMFLKEYRSATEAATSLGVDTSMVVKVCRGKNTKSGGFIFRYKDGEISNTIDVSGVKKSKYIKRPVLQLSVDNRILKEYPSSIEASQETKVNYGTIKWICRIGNMKPLTSGHIFIYKDIFESLNLN